MRRPSRRAIWILALVVAVPLLLVGVLLGLSNTDPGRRLIEQLTSRFSGDRVLVTGLSGHFPGEIHIDRLELRDAKGVWLVATDITLRSAASQLLFRRLDVDRLRAGDVRVARAPVAAVATGVPDPDAGFLRRIDVATLELPRLELGPDLAGAEVLLDLRGHVHLKGTEEVDTALTAHRLDSAGTYELKGQLDAARINASLDVEEPAGGPLQNLAGVPRLGALSAHASISGPRAQEATHLELSAGSLHATAAGSVNWTAGTADLDVEASAPAMAPGPGLSWQAVELQGHYHGKFQAPALAGRLRMSAARLGDVQFRTLSADITGDLGSARANAVIEGLRVPGTQPALFEATPVELHGEAKYGDRAWHATFTAAHALVEVRGQGKAGAQPQLSFTATVASVEPFARLVDLGIRGHGVVTGTLAGQAADWHVELTAGIADLSGSDTWAQLLAPAVKLTLAAGQQGSTLTVSRARLEGGSLKVSADGAEKKGVLDFGWEAEVSKLAALSPALAGSAVARGRIHGPRSDFGATGSFKVDGSAHTSVRGAVELEVRAEGLPSRPSATVESHGSLDGSPIRIDASLRRAPNGGIRALIERAHWRSASATGDLTVPPGERPTAGRVSLEAPHLEDFGRLAGTPMRGSLSVSVEFQAAAGRGRADVRLEAQDAGTPDHRIGHLLVTGRVDAPTTHPVVALTAVADGVVLAGTTGSVRVSATGPEHAVALNFSTHWANAEATVLEASSSAVLDVPLRHLRVTALEATAHEQAVRLLAPATLTFGDGLSVDNLRLGAGGAVIELAGRLTPTLDLTASLTNATPALAAFFPDWQVDGTLTADARLTGPLRAPEGVAHVHGTGLRMRSDSGRGVPPTEIVGSIELHDGNAATDVHVRAGTAADLHVAGSVPIRRDQSFALHADGQIAVATANPFLEPNGRRVRGKATVNADVSGPATDPKVAGTVTVEGGDFQDFAHGAHLSDIALTVVAQDRSLKITRFVAHAGPGTVSVEGTVGVLEPTIPVDLRLTAANAQPLSSDLLTARVDGSLAIKGGAASGLTASGRIHVNRADINIPNALPRDVAVLDVRRPHAKPPPRRSWALAPIALDIAVDAPRAVFVRGRGLDAELGGNLRVGGTYDNPQVGGGFDMRRGTLALAGASLKFTSGNVSFNGGGPRNALDPTLDFAAESTSGDFTATLRVGGYASAPTIALTSVPDVGQDAILAQLLFGSADPKQLSPLQLISIGVALASISGVGYGSADPLGAVQRRLGLDRLAIGSVSGTTPDSNAATVEAGRYVSSRVYVGAVQSTTGITKLQAQVDLTKHLKLQTVVGNGSATAQGTTPQNDPGNTVGLVYQIDY